MAKLTDITIDVKANLNVDRRTAETCLRLVEMYCNSSGVTIIPNRKMDGEYEYTLGPEVLPKFQPGGAFPKVSEDTLAAINAIGRGCHPDDL